MSDKKSQETASGGPKKGSPMKLILLIVIAVVLLGAGAIVGKVMLAGKGKQAKAAEPKAEIGAKVPLEEFLTNLSGGTDHYVKTQIALGVKKGLTEKELEEEFPPIRDVIVSALAARSLKDLSTEEGRTKLKDEIRDKLNEELGKGTVIKVYFMSFAVQ